jgi:tRNA threonylcarbamoyl adenosine modification protein (Sua5/YciO/YrdC/YwlC family)
MYVQIAPETWDLWRLESVVRSLRDGGLGVIPTDTVYAFVCSITSKKAIERLYSIKKMDERKPLSIICHDFSMVSQYTHGFPNSWFRVARRCLPGPYTFILRANNQIPRLMLRKRRTVGVRIPNDPVCLALLSELDAPLLCSSVRTDNDSFWNVPAAISEAYGNRLDFVVDAGERLAEPSSVIDLTDNDPVVIRQGKGDLEPFE